MLRLKKAIFSLAVLASGPASAVPYEPVSDDEVLLVLPRGSGPRGDFELKRLQALLAVEPTDADSAAALAELYEARGRELDDPRYFGMAEAALAPWSGAREAPLPVLQVRARLRGWSHDFTSALEDYDDYLGRRADDVEAQLARSVLLGVMGRVAEAAAACPVLAKAGAEIIATLCRAQVFLLEQRHRDALAAAETLREGRAMPLALQVWTLELLAEAQAGLGLANEAERDFKAALVLAPADVFVKAAYADFLLANGRLEAARALLRGSERNLGLAVRLAGAMKGASLPEAKSLEDDLRERFRAEDARGASPHWRERTIWLLRVANDPKGALAAAERNFETQKEPIDRALLEEARRVAR